MIWSNDHAYVSVANTLLVSLIFVEVGRAEQRIEEAFVSTIPLISRSHVKFFPLRLCSLSLV